MHRRISRGLLALSAMFLGAGQAFAELRDVRVTTDQTVDSTSLESIVRDVIAQSGAKTNDEKAIAILEYLHNTIFHYGYPREPQPQTVGPLKLVNSYGWGLCGSQHTVLKALYETAGWECRYVGWSDPAHTTIEVKYDDRWHYLDVFLKCYFWSKDKSHIASQEEIAADPSIVFDAVKDGRAARQHLCCGDSEKGVVSGVKSRHVVGDRKGWASCTWRDENYSAQLNMPAGSSLRLDWKSQEGGFAGAGRPAVHTCGVKDFREDSVLGPIAQHYGSRGWSNGQFVYAPDFANSEHVADIALAGALAKDGKLVAGPEGGTAVFKCELPYCYADAALKADFAGDGKLFISADAGKTWQEAPAGDISALVRQRYDVWIKAEFQDALSAIRLDGIVQHNRCAAPHLVNGSNKVTVSLDDALPKDAVLTVTYKYQEATVPDPHNVARWDGSNVRYGDVKTVVKQIASAPLTFEINVGGNTPPKMLSLERTIR